MLKSKKKWKNLIAAMLCMAIAVSPVTASADTGSFKPDEIESILSEDFDEIVEQRAADYEQPAVTARSYGAPRTGGEINVTLTVGGRIHYNDYLTSEFWVGDDFAFCLEPAQNTPSAGQYTAVESSDSLLRSMMYYGYGGPGYSSDLGMEKLLDEAIRPYAAALTHMALAYIYDGCSDDTDAFKGTNQGTIDGLKRIVEQMNTFAWTVPSGYHAYVISTGSGSQAIGYGHLEPEGTLKLIKTSANPALTDGNSCYSLEGAEYGVFTDQACTNQVETLTTLADGTNEAELAEGTYWVKEITAPKGFALDETVYQVTVTGGETAILKVTDYPQSDPVGILLGKIDRETNSEKPQGSASLTGAEFTVRYYDGMYDTDPAEQGIGAVRTWVLRTDEDGYCELNDSYKVAGDSLFYATNGDPIIPLGTITIQETKAPMGYLLNSEVFVRQVSSNTFSQWVETYNQPIISEQVIRGGIKIQKRDYETGNTTAQGTATLAGAEFSIINKSPNPVYVNGATYANGQTVATITTDSTGLAQTAADTLPQGYYLLKETKAPEGYLLSGVTEQYFSITENGVIVDLTAPEDSIQDQIIRGGVKIQKRDYETGAASPMGGASLEGAEFGIYSNSEQPVIVGGQPYSKGERVLTITTDSAGLAQTAANALPKGYYTAVELKAPDGYLKGGVLIQNFSITENGVIVDLTDKEHSIQDQVIRGDFELRKIDSEYQDSMPGVQFEITSVATGECHTITTDENGEYSSASRWNPHTSNTNGGGAYDGLWFGQTMDGHMAEADDSLGALPVGDYAIDELPGYANVGKDLFHGTLHITRNGYTVDLGNIENEGEEPPITITTQAKEAATDSQIAQAGENITIVDEVTLEGVIPKREYTVQGTLMDKETKEPLLIGGEKVTAEYTFTAEHATEKIELTFILDGSDLAGKTVVAFEKCSYRRREVAAHENINDPAQAVFFPEISTSLKDSVTGSHIAEAAGEMTLIDEVSYKGLQPGKPYTVKGILMDKTTGEELLVNGKTVTAEQTFTPEESEGKAELTFTFDGSALAGETIVAFERLYYEEREIAVHTDIEDEEQSVHIPEITTELKDNISGSHTAEVAAEMTLIDEVTYRNLIPGKTYTMQGILMDKITGEELLVNGKPVTAEQTFTPEESEGSVELTFTFDGSALGGKSVVAFETCLYEGKEIAVHHDIQDEDQTVGITELPVEPEEKPEEPEHLVSKPRTGDHTPVGVVAVILCAAGVALGLSARLRKLWKESPKE